MALNLARVTFSFQQHAYGWTENYFLPTPSTDLSAEITKARTLAQKRIAMSGAETSLPYFKVSREQVLRDVYVEGTYNVGNAGEPSDSPSTALLINRWTINWSVKSPLYLRGLWDRLNQSGGEWLYTDPAWLAVFNAYKAYLVSAGFGFVGRDPVARKVSAVSGVVQNLDGTAQVTTTDNVFVGLAAGTRLKVFLSGVQGAASVNGQQVVIVVSNNQCNTYRRLPILPYTTGGQLSFNTPIFYAFSSMNAERIVERKVGRPLFLSRGRARGRRLY